MALQGPMVVKGVLVSNAFVQFFISNIFPPHSVKGTGSVFFDRSQAEANTLNKLDNVTLVCQYDQEFDEIAMLDQGALLDPRFANMTIVEDVDLTPPNIQSYAVKKIPASSGTGFD